MPERAALSLFLVIHCLLYNGCSVLRKTLAEISLKFPVCLKIQTVVCFKKREETVLSNYFP